MPYITKGVYENGSWTQKSVYVSDEEYKATIRRLDTPAELRPVDIPVASTPVPVPEIIDVNVQEQTSYKEAVATIQAEQTKIDEAKKQLIEYQKEPNKYDPNSLLALKTRVESAQRSLNTYSQGISAYGKNLAGKQTEYISKGGLTDVGRERLIARQEADKIKQEADKVAYGGLTEAGLKRLEEPKYKDVYEKAQIQQGKDIARNAILQGKDEVVVKNDLQLKGAKDVLGSKGGLTDIGIVKAKERQEAKKVAFGGLTDYGLTRSQEPYFKDVAEKAEIQQGKDLAINAMLQGKPIIVKTDMQLKGAKDVVGRGGGLTEYGLERAEKPYFKDVAEKAEIQRGYDIMRSAMFQGKEDIMLKSELQAKGASKYIDEITAVSGGLTLAGMIKTSTPEYQKVIEASDIARSKDLERWAKEAVKSSLISGKEVIPVKTQAQFLAVENLLKTDYVNEVFEDLMLSKPKGAVTSSPITQTDLGSTTVQEPISFTELGGDLITKYLYGGTGLAGVGKDVAEVGLAGLGFFEGIGRSLAYGVGSVLPFTDLNPKVSKKISSDLIMKGSVRVPSGSGAGISLVGSKFLGTSEVSLPTGLGFDLGLGSQYDVGFAEKHPSFAVASALLDVFAIKGMFDLGAKGVKVSAKGLINLGKSGGKGVTKLVDEFKVKPVKPFKPLDTVFREPISEQLKLKAGKPYPKLSVAETKSLINFNKDISFRAPLSEQLKIKSGKPYPKLSSAETKALIDLRKDIVFRSPLSEQLKLKAGKPYPKLTVAETKTLIDLRTNIGFKLPLSEQTRIRAGKPYPTLSSAEMKGLIDVYKPIEFKQLRLRGMLPKDKPLSVSEMNKATEFLPLKEAVKPKTVKAPELSITEMNLLAKRLPSWREKVTPVLKTEVRGKTVTSGKTVLITEQKPLLKNLLQQPQKLKPKTVKAPSLLIKPELMGVLTTIRPQPQKPKVKQDFRQKQLIQLGQISTPKIEQSLTYKPKKVGIKQVTATNLLYTPITTITPKIKVVTTPKLTYKQLTQTKIRQVTTIKPIIDLQYKPLTTPKVKQVSKPSFSFKSLTLQTQKISFKQITTQTTIPKLRVDLKYTPIITPKIKQVTTPDPFQGFDFRFPAPTKTRTTKTRDMIPRWSDAKTERKSGFINSYGRKKFVNPLASVSQVLGNTRRVSKKYSPPKRSRTAKKTTRKRT